MLLGAGESADILRMPNAVGAKTKEHVSAGGLSRPALTHLIGLESPCREPHRASATPSAAKKGLIYKRVGCMYMGTKERAMYSHKWAGALALVVLFALPSGVANAQARIGSANSVKPDASGTVAGTLSAGSSVHANET